MQLYTVHFKTRKIEGDVTTFVPQTIHALPRATALSYAKFSSFQMEPYVIEGERRPDRHRNTWMGGPKKAATRTLPGERPAPAGKKISKEAKSGGSTVQNAAASGDLAAAINAGAK